MLKISRNLNLISVIMETWLEEITSVSPAIPFVAIIGVYVSDGVATFRSF